MSRFLPFVFCALASALLAVPTSADDPPKKLTPAERKELDAKCDKLLDAAREAYVAGKYPEATRLMTEALTVTRQLYPKADFPDGHTDLASAMNNLAILHERQGNLAAAEPLCKDASGETCTDNEVIEHKLAPEKMKNLND